MVTLKLLVDIVDVFFFWYEGGGFGMENEMLELDEFHNLFWLKRSLSKIIE